MESGVRKDHAAVAAVLLCLALLWQAGPAGGAVEQEARLFERAYEYYLAFQPDKAVSAFDQFLKEYPTSSARDSVLFWQARSLLLMNRSDDARSVFERLISDHPESPYRRFAEQEVAALGSGKRQAVPSVPAQAPAAPAGVPEDAAEMKKEATKLAAEAEKRELALRRALEDRAGLEARLEKAAKEYEQLAARVKEGEAASVRARQLSDENAALRQSLSSAERREDQVASERLAQLQQLKGEVEALKKADSERERLLNDERAKSDAAAKRIRELEALSRQHVEQSKSEAARQDEQDKKDRERLAAESKALREERDRLSALAARLETKGQEGEARQDAQQKEIQSLQSALARMRDEQAKTRDEKTSLSGELEQARARIIGLEQASARIEKSADERTRELVASSKALEKTIAKLTAEAEKREQDIKKASDDRAAIETRLETAKKEHEQLAIKVKEGEAAIVKASQLSDENAALRQSLASAERKEEQAAPERQAQLQQLKGEVDTLKKAGSEKDRMLTDERAKSDIAARRIKELEELSKQRLDKLKTELAALVLKEIDSKQKNWEDLDAYLKELRSEKESLTVSLGERDRLIEAKEKELQSLRQNRAAAEELKGVIEERDTLKTRVAEAERLKTEATRRADQDKKDRERLAAEVKALQDDRDRLSALVADFEAKGLEGRARHAAQEKEIRSLQSSLNRMSAEQATTAEEKKQISGQLETARARISEIEATIAKHTGLEEKVAASLKERQALLAATEAERKRADGEQEKAKQAEGRVKDTLSERDALQARIAGLEKIAKDEQFRTASELKALREERDGLVGRLKEAEKIRAAGASQSEDAARRIEALSTDLERIRREHEEEKKTLTASLSQVRDDKIKLGRKVEELSDTAKRFETPVVKISGRSYTLSHIFETALLSNAVLKKLGRDNRPWKKRGLIEDFIAEEVLSREAARRGISPDAAEIQSLLRRLSLDEKEQSYLKKYHAIERLVKAKMDEKAVDERAVRDYYEKNREQFVERQAGRQARVLSVRYDRGAELEKSLTALELRQEALAGRSFEEIQKGRRDGISVRSVPIDELPGWIREKLDHLADGEVSPVYSTGKEHMVMVLHQKKPSYRRFEDVKDEIALKIGPRSKGAEFLSAWIDELAADVEYLR